MFVALSKRILFINPYIFAALYGCVLIILSIIFNWIEIPATYFSDSKNILNVFFMKYSYVYIIVFLLPFVTCLHLIYGFGNWRNVVIPILRFFTCGIILCAMSTTFDISSYLFGVCSASEFNNEEFICRWYSYKWKAFDISGHIFHNIFGILIIIEEASYYKFWPLIELLMNTFDFSSCRDPRQVQNVQQFLIAQVNNDNKIKLQKLFDYLSTFLKVNFCALAVLVILLHIANLLTVIYFHTVMETIMAVILALLAWILCYIAVFSLYGINPCSIEIHHVLLKQIENGEDTIEAEYFFNPEVKKWYNTV